MRTFTAWISATALAAGGVAGVGAYQLTSGSVTVEQAPIQDESATIPTAQPTPTEVVWADCEPPSKLEDGECVTEVTQTIAVPAAPAPSSHNTGQPTGARDDDSDDQAESDDDEGFEDEFDDESEDESEDADDADDHGDDGDEADEPDDSDDDSHDGSDD